MLNLRKIASFQVFLCGSRQSWSGSTWNFNSPPQSDLGIWPNHRYSEIYMRPHIHIAPRFGLRQMSTDSLSSPLISPLRLFEISLHKPIYSSFPNSNNIGNLSILDCILQFGSVLQSFDFSSCQDFVQQSKLFRGHAHA